RIAEYGLSENLGMSVGKMILGQIEEGLLGDDIHHFAMALTAAATDARMSGCSLPVISNTGSGNQGLSITLPIIAAAEKLKRSHETLVRALTLGHLVSVHMKYKVGLLSCLCGCLSAASGAACGIVLLLGGDYRKVEYAIKNMVGNTAGMVCDGAKEGCSLKVATNTSAAVQAALLAHMGKCISSNDGIITDNIDETIENLAEFVNSGMQNADSTILNIMINKKINREATNS
ncbi:MAG TPA: L-serine ammonia-lyase, iron-sulfur-dependent, subunit alpha, partial [Candidatus Cloacimonadota bacterium]|nr:L-serine ammonia-lyase, iron-sulfur-dependent, subunit alpha [Candidatus Cloacimonadota bacterium]